MFQELVLKEASGQHSDVKISRRNNGTVYVTFTMRAGYGYPSLELDDLKVIVNKMEAMERGE